MLKNKKGLSLIIGASMLLSTIQMPISAAEIASPVIVSYTVPAAADKTAVMKYADSNGNNTAISGGTGWSLSSYWHTGAKPTTDTLTASTRLIRKVVLNEKEYHFINPSSNGAGMYRTVADENVINAGEDAEYYISFTARNADGNAHPTSANSLATDHKFFIGANDFYVSFSKAHTYEGEEAGYYLGLTVGGESQLGTKYVSNSTIYNNLVYIKTNADGTDEVKYQSVPLGTDFDLNTWDLTASPELGTNKYTYIGFQSNGQGTGQVGDISVEKYTADSAVNAKLADIDALIESATPDTYATVKSQITSELALIPDCVIKPELSDLYAELDKVCVSSDSPLIAYDYIDLSSALQAVADKKTVSYYTDANGGYPAVSGGYGWASNSYWHTGTAATTEVTTAANRYVRVRSTSDGTVNMFEPAASGAGLYRTLARPIDLTGSNEYYISFYSNNAYGTDAANATTNIDNRFIIGNNNFYISASYTVKDAENADNSGYFPGIKAGANAEFKLGSKKIEKGKVYNNLVYIKANADGNEVVKYQTVPYGEEFDYSNWDVVVDNAEIGGKYAYVGVQSNGSGVSDMGAFRIEEYTPEKKAEITAPLAGIEEIVSDITAETYSTKTAQVNAIIETVLANVTDCYVKEELAQTLVSSALVANSDTVIYDDIYCDGADLSEGGYQTGRYYLSKLNYSGNERTAGTYYEDARSGGFGWSSIWDPYTINTDKISYTLGDTYVLRAGQQNGLNVASGNNTARLTRGFETPLVFDSDSEYYLSFTSTLNSGNKAYLNGKAPSFKFGDGIAITANYQAATDTENESVVLSLTVGEETVSTGIKIRSDIVLDYVLAVSENAEGKPVVKLNVGQSPYNFRMDWDFEYTFENAGTVAEAEYFSFTGPATILHKVRVDKCDKAELEAVIAKIAAGDYCLSEVNALKDSYAKTGFLNALSMPDDSYKLTKLEFANENGTVTELSSNTGKVKARIRLASSYDDNNDLKLIIASYQNGHLAECKITDFTAYANNATEIVETDFVSVPTTDEALANYKISVFVWNGSLKPAVENVVFASKITVDENEAAAASFLTIDEAIYAANKMAEYGLTNSDGDIKVTINSGEHYINDTLTIDNKNEEINIIIEGKNGASVTGAKTIDFENITAVTEQSVLERLSDDIQDNIKQISIPDGIEIGEEDVYGNSVSVMKQLGISYNSTPPVVIMENGEAMNVARYPDNDYITVSEVIESGSNLRMWMSDKKGEEGYIPPEERDNPPIPLTFKTADVSKDRLKTWANAEDMRVHGFWGVDWSDLAMGANVNPENYEITTELPTVYPTNIGARFYVYNVLEELDNPGEYFIDKENRMIYYYPKDENAKISISVLKDPIMEISVSKNILIDGVELAGCNGNIIEISDSDNIVISDCVVKDCLGVGINIENSSNCTVKDCEVYNTGEGGIFANGGDLKTLTPANNLITNNHIYDFSKRKLMYSPGIRLSGVGNTASHNEIHGTDHMAVNFSGNDNIIEYNEIYDAVRSTRDAAAIYAYESRTGRGNIIRHNYIHDIASELVDEDDKYGVHAIYLDGRRDGTTVESNVFYNIRGAALWINAGRDNIFKNNICIETDYAVHFAYSKYDKKDVIEDGWDSFLTDMSAEQRALYIERYPGLATFYDEACNYPIATRFNKAYDNVMLNIENSIKYDNGIRFVSGDKTWFISEAVGDGQNIMENPVIYAESESIGFTDYENKNFSLSANSDIYNQIENFVAPDFENTGLTN